MVQAVTFDFWDTIAIDDSDEPKRAALGLPGKAEARIELFARHVTQHHPHVAYEQAAAAYAYANQRFRHDWHTEHRTPRVTTRVYYAYEYLGLEPKPGHYGDLVQEVDALVRHIEAMEIRIPPDFAPGVRAALAELKQEYTLAIISDTIHTHGRGLRNLLHQQGLLEFFDYFIFSDEVGASKPSNLVFRRAMNDLGLGPRQIVHVGDRESNDVAGPLSMGMWSILFTGIIDRGSEQSRAHAVCRSYRELPGLIRRLP
ncbi:MAG: HAD family hydrolase [Caldilineaceae bacterium]|nr:HAD family hydrolase [Caldilineaceae bacterium]